MARLPFSAYLELVLTDVAKRYGFRFSLPDDSTARLYRDDIELVIEKEFFSQVVEFTVRNSARDSYDLPQVAAWAGVEYPKMVAETEAAERSVADWVANLIRQHCAPLLLGDKRAWRNLDEAAREHNWQYTRSLQKGSAMARADKASYRRDIKGVVTALSEWESELDDRYAALLADARRLLEEGNRAD